MPSPAVVVLLLASAVADLTSEAAGSDRPRACPPLAEGSHAAHALWQRARQRELEGFCNQLARARIALGTAPAEALKAAQALTRQWPDRSEPKVLVARALAQLGRYADAWPLWAALTPAAAKTPGATLSSEPGEPCVTGTPALHDLALSAAMTGHDALAVSSYRALVTRSASDPDRAYRERVRIEASAAALRVDLPGAEEALGYLTAAGDARSSVLLRTFATGLGLLARVLRPASVVDGRTIDSSAAWQFLSQVESPAPRASWPVLPRHELLGVAALVIQPHATERAIELWRQYIAGLEARVAAGQPQPGLARAEAELARMLSHPKAAP